MKPKAVTPHPLARASATHIIVHYAEVGLKGKNRSRFENRLLKNLRTSLKGMPSTNVHRLFGRLVVRLDKSIAWSEVAPLVSKVFGVAYVLPALSCDCNVAQLRATADRAIDRVSGDYSFAVKCKRSSKSLPFTSMDVQRDLGAHIQQRTGWRVNLDDPDIVVRVELVNDTAYLAIDRVEGPGGLPTGVSGRVVCLQSGGIDSPVAAYHLLQRGSLPIYAHFHSYPHTGVESQEKVKELVDHIHPVGIRSRLYMIPFAELQRKIMTQCPAGLRVILYRRFMVRAAELIARQEGALALVTGESLGQVASQTLENLHTIDTVCELPILRPLIGMDKVAIINQARSIDTYETSIEPHDDCCSYLMPANPATHSTPEELEKVERIFDCQAEIEALIENSTIVNVGNDPTPHALDATGS